MENEDFEAPYMQPFRSRPLRFLWWLDDYLHRHDAPLWLQHQLCDFVDRRLW